MNYRIRITAISLLLTFLLIVPANAETEFFKEFKSNYDLLLSELSRKPSAEVAEISDFVYQKDIVTFHLKSGKMYLLRHILGRPSTAIFIGEGSAVATVPVHTERQSLFCCSRDTTVNEAFDVCFIRMADDFDLKLREKFTFEETELPWRDFNKSQQGEFFFKPVVMHEYDNLFQLLRSLYDRDENGYFWCDFGRYVYSYDPNRPQQSIIAYEHEGGDMVVTNGAVLQRTANGIIDDSQVSDIDYPTTLLEREAELRMTGLDGTVIDTARVDIRLLVNADSLRFVSLFLHYNLKLDSVHYNGQSVDYRRRRDFTFFGVILPSYTYRNDTLSFRLWYRGKNYGAPLPFVEDPSPTTVKLTFDIPKGYNYLMPSMGDLVDVGGGRVRFEVTPSELYANFQFQPYASGYDTIPIVSDLGLTVNFIKSQHLTKSRYACFVQDELYRSAVMGGFNFMTGRLGMPPAAFEMFVFPESTLTMPGLMEVPQVQCLQIETGGVHMVAGKAAARQWFGALTRPASDREYWVVDAVPDYLSLMYVANSLGHSVFFGEMGKRRNYVYTEVENKDDLPLASGKRMEPNNRTAKGAWVIHMLRYLMYDLEARTERDFVMFIRALATHVNNQTFTNTDVVALAEKSYGASLDWFFHHWLYRAGLPEYKVEYTPTRRDDGYYLDVNVTTKGVGGDFKMPIIMRVEDKSGQSTYHRQVVSGHSDSFALGPFEVESEKLIFNEFWSVLSKDKVDKK